MKHQWRAGAATKMYSGSISAAESGISLKHGINAKYRAWRKKRKASMA